jgi:acetyltransferase-like isoleucine patch superfamily enzyme
MRILDKILLKYLHKLDIARIRDTKRRLKYCGKHVLIYPSCQIIVPEEMEIGDNSSIAPHTTIYATFGVRIGKNCLISSNCGISSYNHIQNSSNRPANVQEDSKYSKQVIIGDNVWIGMNVCILPGVEIGNNAIIGAGSVVTKSIPSDEIWFGNPAHFVKKIKIE